MSKKLFKQLKKDGSILDRTDGSPIELLFYYYDGDKKYRGQIYDYDLDDVVFEMKIKKADDMTEAIIKYFEICKKKTLVEQN